MSGKKIKNKLSKLYKKITNKKFEWKKIDENRYFDQFIETVKLNPIFNKLYKKYDQKDIFTNKDKILNNYIYVYIFFDVLWEDIKESKELKNKIFQLKFPVVKDRIFVNVKRFTLDWGYKLHDFLFKLGFDGVLYKYIMFVLGISVNIFEAIITDIIHLEFKNPFVGFLLILSLPFLNKFTGINKRYISDIWIKLYTSWNYHFIYNGGPSLDCFPVAGICLINSFKHIKDDLWIDNRLYTLYLTTILANDEIFLSTNKINKKFVDDWNNYNLKYAKKLFIF